MALIKKLSFIFVLLYGLSAFGASNFPTGANVTGTLNVISTGGTNSVTTGTDGTLRNNGTPLVSSTGTVALSNTSTVTNGLSTSGTTAVLSAIATGTTAVSGSATNAGTAYNLAAPATTGSYFGMTTAALSGSNIALSSAVVSATNVNIPLMGDSIMYGYLSSNPSGSYGSGLLGTTDPGGVLQTLPFSKQATVSNWGYPGVTVTYGTTYYTSQIHPLVSGHSATVVVEYGANDWATNDLTPPAYFTILNAIITSIHADGGKAAVCTIPDEGLGPTYGGGELWRMQANSLIRSSTNIDILMDLDSEFPQTTDTNFFNADGTHFTNAGYRQMAKYFAFRLAQGANGAPPMGNPAAGRVNAVQLTQTSGTGAGMVGYTNFSTSNATSSSSFSAGWLLYSAAGFDYGGDLGYDSNTSQYATRLFAPGNGSELWLGCVPQSPTTVSSGTAYEIMSNTGMSLGPVGSTAYPVRLNGVLQATTSGVYNIQGGAYTPWNSLAWSDSGTTGTTAGLALLNTTNVSGNRVDLAFATQDSGALYVSPAVIAMVTNGTRQYYPPCALNFYTVTGQTNNHNNPPILETSIDINGNWNCTNGVVTGGTSAFNASSTFTGNIIISGTNSGTFTLTSGAGSIINANLTTSSVIVTSVQTKSGTLGTYQPECVMYSGSCAITGLATDNSTYNYRLIY